MSRYESRQEFAEMLEATGGLTDLLEHGGFDPYEDLPEGDDDLAETASTMIYKWREFQEWVGYFEAELADRW